MNILLVEDSDEVSCITVEYLHELGHQVVAVAEAEKAIAQLKNADVRRGHDGHSFARHVGNRTRPGR